MTTTLEHAASTDRWTPARWFFLIIAITHLPLGVGGFIVDRTFPVGAEAARLGDRGYVFGVFETNGWHSLAALLLGVLGVWMVVRPHGAARTALILGIAHVGIVVSLIARDPSAFWFASNAVDQLVHAGTALGGISTGLLTRRTSS